MPILRECEVVVVGQRCYSQVKTSCAAVSSDQKGRVSLESSLDLSDLMRCHSITRFYHCFSTEKSQFDSAILNHANVLKELSIISLNHPLYSLGKDILQFVVKSYWPVSEKYKIIVAFDMQWFAHCSYPNRVFISDDITIIYFRIFILW